MSINKIFSSLLSRALLMAAAIGMLITPARAQNYTMTNVWTVAAGTVPYLSLTSSGERGMCYNPNTGHLLLVSRESPNRIVVLNSADGSSNNVLNLSGVITSGTSITFLLDFIACDANGVIYAADLTSPSANVTNNFVLYRWANESATPTIAYHGPIGAAGGTTTARYGDVLALTGTGLNTEIAVGANAGGGFCVFTTPDGMSFVPNVMTNSTATSGDLQPGLDFYGTTNYFSKHSGGVAFHESVFTLGVMPPTTQETTTNTANGSYGPLKVSGSSNWLVSLNTQSGASDSGHYVGLYNIGVGGSLTYVTSNAIVATTGGSGNGNASGSVCIAGSNVYVLDTDNAIEAFAILPVVVLTPPTATISPSSVTEYVGNPNTTFTASTTGSLPIYFQWYQTTASGTVKLANATNSSYTLGTATTAQAGTYTVAVSNAASTNISAGATLTVQTPFTTGRLSNIWSLPPGSRFYLDNASYAQRGLAYDPTGDLLLASRYPTNLIAVLNASTGADKWLMNVDPTVITGANTTYPLNTIGVGDDGVVYGVPLVIQGQNGFELYVWNDDTPASGPELAYQGDPGGGTYQRWGDSMAVTGAGGNTMILLGSGSATNTVSVLTSGDGGYTFGPTVLTVTDPANGSLVGFAGLGVAWGSNNTFWAKSLSYNLRQLSYNLTAGTATVLNNYSTPFQGSQGTAIGIDKTSSLLAMLAFDSPHSVRLYDLWFSVPNPALTPDIIDQALFPVNNANVNYTGAIAFPDPYLYVLDSNNGIQAYQVSTGVVSPFTLNQPTVGANGSATLSWPSPAGHSYQVQYVTNSLYQTNVWNDDGQPFSSSSTNTTFTDGDVPPGTNAFFRVIGH